jgi:tetratricopeptide (TPR) repeat protein
VETELLFAPSGEVLRVASLGYEDAMASLLWLRVVLTFGERWQEAPNQSWQEWMGKVILAISELDPGWRTLYTYGGLMLKVTENYELSTEIMELGAERLPSDHFLPFSIGMNYFLYLDDVDQAYTWINRASEKEGAPTWYRGAARAFVAQRAQRGVAIRFLEEELAATTDEELQESLNRHLSELQHEQWVEELGKIHARLSEEGVVVLSPEDLVAPGAAPFLPQDPLGGEWVLDVDGVVRSSVAAESEWDHARRYERGLLEAL